MIWAGVILVVLMAILGAPLFAVVLGAAMLGFLAVGVDLSVVAINIYDMTDKPLLVALPFFTLAGYLMAAAKSSERLMALTRALFGWMPAGLAIVGFVACALFTALTGASGVTIVALGALLLPMLKSSGYTERYKPGPGDHLGKLGTPHRPVRAADPLRDRRAADGRGGESFSIGELFIAGLGPALLMVLLLSLWTMLRVRRCAPDGVRRASALGSRQGRALGVAAAFRCPRRHLFGVLRDLRSGPPSPSSTC